MRQHSPLTLPMQDTHVPSIVRNDVVDVGTAFSDNFFLFLRLGYLIGVLEVLEEDDLYPFVNFCYSLHIPYLYPSPNYPYFSLGL